MGCGGSVGPHGTGTVGAGKYEVQWEVNGCSSCMRLSTSSGVPSSSGSRAPRRASASRRKVLVDVRQHCNWNNIPADVKRLSLSSFEQQDVLVQTDAATVFRLRHRDGGHQLAGKRIERGCSAQ